MVRVRAVAGPTVYRGISCDGVGTGFGLLVAKSYSGAGSVVSGECTAVLRYHVREAFDGALTCEDHATVFGAGGIGIV